MGRPGARPAHVGIVGGGWAGLAAAVEHAGRGDRVTLYEMAGQLGGRARSVAVGERLLDNGQHILIGACTATFDLMRRVGVDVDTAFLRLPLTLVRPDGSGLRLPNGAPTIAFARAVAARHSWPLRERLGLLATAGAWMARGFRAAPTASVADLCRHLGPHARDEFIEPLCVAALNTPAKDASATVFLRVLKDALFTGPGSSDLMLPKAGLSALLPEPAAAWLTSRGATLRLGTRVSKLTATRDGRWSLDGDPYDRVVLATTSSEAARLTRTLAPAWSTAAADFRFEPIVTVYAHHPAARLAEPMLALPADEDTAPAQFIFDRGVLDGQEGVLALVVSGAAPWVARGLPATTTAALAQAKACLPAGAALTALQTFTEKRATFRCTPGLARPPAHIAAGLTAAGDYVEGPYPATLEGAIRSGLAAAGHSRYTKSRHAG